MALTQENIIGRMLNQQKNHKFVDSDSLAIPASKKVAIAGKEYDNKNKCK